MFHLASDTPVAQQARRKLSERYGDLPPLEADVIVALGGDGFMIEPGMVFTIEPGSIMAHRQTSRAN